MFPRCERGDAIVHTSGTVCSISTSCPLATTWRKKARRSFLKAFGAAASRISASVADSAGKGSG